MPSMQFQPVLREIRDVLSQDYYNIPRFQRPYSWNQENLEDFWRDAVMDNDEGYFIGPMVAYSGARGSFSLVDGQQRMTSITLGLAALRDLLVEMGDEALATGLQKYLERADDDNNTHYVLQSESVKRYLPSQILARPPRMREAASSEEEKTLQQAFKHVRSWFEDQIEGLSRVPDGDELSDAAAELRNIRDKILSLRIIWIRLDLEDDAYVVFETLNSRGKDLEVVDLLKNFLLQAAKAQNADLDLARTYWGEMRENLHELGGGANPNKFILHWWLSNNEYTAERKLFRLIKKSLHPEDANAVLIELRDDAVLYSRIADPMNWQCEKYEVPVRDSLYALELFGVRQPRPMLLSLLRAYRDKEVRFARVRDTLAIIEAFHFQTTAIVGISSTGGVSEMYAKHARELSQAESSEDRHRAIHGLVQKLKTSDRLPQRETFLTEFPHSLYYSDAHSGQKRLVQYALRKIHDFESGSAATDHSKCTIEHLSPQKDGENFVGEIGNLFWIEATLNGELAARTFEEKRKLLLEKVLAVNLEDVVHANDWGEEQISRRSCRLAELALDQVWRI